MAELTNEEALEIHRDYTEMHKKAFRAAFDFLMEVWPPKNDPDWFRTVATPAVSTLYADNMENRLARRLLLEVFAYVDEMAGKLNEKGDKVEENSDPVQT